MRIRQLLFLSTGALAGAVALLALGGPSLAQPWPAKQPIKVILTFSAGSSLDVLGRPVFDHVSKQLGQAAMTFCDRPYCEKGMQPRQNRPRHWPRRLGERLDLAGRAVESHIRTVRAGT